MTRPPSETPRFFIGCLYREAGASENDGREGNTALVDTIADSSECEKAELNDGTSRGIKGTDDIRLIDGGMAPPMTLITISISSDSNSCSACIKQLAISALVGSSPILKMRVMGFNNCKALETDLIIRDVDGLLTSPMSAPAIARGDRSCTS